MGTVDGLLQMTAPLPALKYVNAGVISIRGGLYDVDLAPSDTGYEAYANGESALFEGGESLQFTSTGGQNLAPFACNVVAPPQIRINPAMPPVKRS